MASPHFFPGRVATSDGSQALQGLGWRKGNCRRRVATREIGYDEGFATGQIQASLRDAPQDEFDSQAINGLATINGRYATVFGC